jgi:dTDP-4-dehydrorhamnose reductase
MKVLVTGANGMVARAAIAHCRSLGDEIFAYTRQEMDISDDAAVEEIFYRNKPDAVINCAAYTDVDGAETNAEKCYAVNAVGVENLAAASRKINSAFVTISTDYVFDGENPGFYTEEDKPNPLGVYGKAKLEGENGARRANPASMIVRSGWIYGAGGTNFLSRMHLFLAEGKSIKAISDSYGTPTYADDLAKRLRELVGLNKPGIYHVTNSGEGTSYAGFARKVAELIGAGQSLVEEVSADSMQRPAPRPRSSKLGSSKLGSSKLASVVLEKIKLAPLPDWEKALENFLKSENLIL